MSTITAVAAGKSDTGTSFKMQKGNDASAFCNVKKFSRTVCFNQEGRDDVKLLLRSSRKAKENSINLVKLRNFILQIFYAEIGPFGVTTNSRMKKAEWMVKKVRTNGCNIT